MIYVDPRGGADPTKNAQKEILAIIKRLGLRAELATLDHGDFMFEGNGPEGPMAVGIERKTVHDLLNCIEDARYNQQRIGMKEDYQVSVLMLEGQWKPHERGFLMESWNGGVSFNFLKFRRQETMYSKLYRYLISVQLSGVILMQTRDIFQSAYNVTEWFHYFQKPWQKHESLLDIPKLQIPTLNQRPSLTRMWAHDIKDIGVTFSARAERLFRTPLRLAQADELEWVKIPGIGVKTAQQIVREIWTGRRD